MALVYMDIDAYNTEWCRSHTWKRLQQRNLENDKEAWEFLLSIKVETGEN